ncbi:hypothetical protein LTR37_014263 [Vermiconidia calcicola]|uniref:Uncharacterized protein n=1 Tax=Vermiconidia calcicola TaxID=1690605 RepID=A0ACC3MTV5_9PEZI|nr:hypothetical protein LTR37_014263 [Vermiconidia calcicola]
MASGAFSAVFGTTELAERAPSHLDRGNKLFLDPKPASAFINEHDQERVISHSQLNEQVAPRRICERTGGPGELEIAELNPIVRSYGPQTDRFSMRFLYSEPLFEKLQHGDSRSQMFLCQPPSLCVKITYSIRWKTSYGMTYCRGSNGLLQRQPVGDFDDRKCICEVRSEVGVTVGQVAKKLRSLLSPAELEHEGTATLRWRTVDVVATDPISNVPLWIKGHLGGEGSTV